MFAFMKSFLGIKGQQVGRDMVDALVAFDPKSATQAQLQVMEQDLDKTGLLLAQLRAELDREIREAQAATANYNRLIAAAEHLENQIAGTADPAQRAQLEQSLGTLVGKLEELRPEVDSEEQDVVEARRLLDETEAAYREKAQALAEARKVLERAGRDMSRAKIDQERNEARARKAAEVAGLRGGQDNKLHTALDAMRRQADEARAKAEAARVKAEILTSHAPGGALGDRNIEAALQAVGTGRASGSASERLAALRVGGRAPAAALPAPGRKPD
ncbi:MAG TPA: hypothetical protein VEH84_12465 [Alphaproteobacteria bacterium]|nr:hypothetical protein [Alphaproteobacteria bacterium]